jgi:hypothetical protein
MDTKRFVHSPGMPLQSGNANSYCRRWQQTRKDDSGSDYEADIFSIPVPKVNRLQALKDSFLAVCSNGGMKAEDDSLAFKSSWSRDAIESWIRVLFPKVWLYLMEHHPLGDSDTFYWIPLVRENKKLVPFVKKGRFTGNDLETIKGPAGKHWLHQTIYFGACFCGFDNGHH